MEINVTFTHKADPELAALLRGLLGGAQTPAVVVPIEVKTATKEKAVKKVQEPEKTVEPAPTESKAEEPVKSEHTAESLMKLAVPKSRAGHKDAIRAKVTELGYDSLADIKPEHFDAFYDFITKL